MHGNYLKKKVQPRSSHRRMCLLKKVFLKSLRIIHRKRSVHGTLFKQRCRFPVEFTKILRAHFLHNIPRRLLLSGIDNRLYFENNIYITTDYCYWYTFCSFKRFIKSPCLYEKWQIKNDKWQIKNDNLKHFTTHNIIFRNFHNSS